MRPSRVFVVLLTVTAVIASLVAPVAAQDGTPVTDPPIAEPAPSPTPTQTELSEQDEREELEDASPTPTQPADEATATASAVPQARISTQGEPGMGTLALATASFDKPTYWAQPGGTLQVLLTTQSPGNFTAGLFVRTTLAATFSDVSVSGGSSAGCRAEIIRSTTISAGFHPYSTCVFVITLEVSPNAGDQVQISASIAQPDIEDALATIQIVDDLMAESTDISVPNAGSTDGQVTATGGRQPYTFTIANGDGPAKGNVTLNANGTFTYTADPGATGSDTFTVTVTESSPLALTAQAPVNVTIASALIATGDDLTVPFEGAGNGAITATGGTTPFTFAVTQDPARGSVALNPDGTFTYSADDAAVGDDTFTVTVTDRLGSSDDATVNVTIGPAVFAIGDDLAVPYEGAGSGALTATGGTTPYTFVLTQAPTKGSVVLNADGTFTYSADDAAVGDDSFDVTVIDALGSNDDATVNVTIASELIAPGDELTVPFEGEGNGAVTATGGTAPYAFDVTQDPAKGSVTLNADGTFTYAADDAAVGDDSFAVTVTDELGQTAIAEVIITISAEIVAEDSAISVSYQGTAGGAIVVTGGTTPYSFAVTQDPAKGEVTIEPDGALTYTAGTGQTGEDSFGVTITDALGQTDAATVSVTISASPLEADAVPLAVTYEGRADGMIIVSGGTPPYTFAVTQDPAKGTVTIEDDGTVEYVAGQGQTGPDQFTVGISDAADPAQQTEVTVGVAIAPPPLVVTTLTLEVEASDTITGDLSGQVSGGVPPYTFTILVGPGQGTLELAPDGTFTYTASPGATGPDSFTYSVTDTADPGAVTLLAATTGTVELTILAPPPSPTVAPTPTATPTVAPTKAPKVEPTVSPTKTPPVVTALPATGAGQAASQSPLWWAYLGAALLALVGALAWRRTRVR